MVTARGLAMHALVALERGRSDRLKSELDDRGLEGRDLAFAYELAHGVVRRERVLDFVLGCFAHRGLPKDPQLKVALRLGAYQLMFVPGMPAHAAVHETVELVRNNKGFANAMLRNLAQAIGAPEEVARAADVAGRIELGPTRVIALTTALPDDEVERLAMLHSLPDWLARRVADQHGLDGLRRVAEAAGATPAIHLRTAAGVPRESLADELRAADCAVEPVEHPRMLRWSEGGAPFQTDAYALGRFVVQDPTALLAVEAVPCGPGDRVLDLCAAPGTKTTRLAEQVRPGGRVFAHDPDQRRRGRIAENVARLALADTVELTDDPEAAATAGGAAGFDAVLVDAPCSNTGVLGRRVEVRRRLQPETIDELAALQRELLLQALRLVRPGGHVVYSTCSIDRAENADVVAAVLAELGDDAPTVASAVETLPRAGHHDGGYHAVLRR